MRDTQDTNKFKVHFFLQKFYLFAYSLQQLPNKRRTHKYTFLYNIELLSLLIFLHWCNNLKSSMLTWHTKLITLFRIYAVINCSIRRRHNKYKIKSFNLKNWLTENPSFNVQIRIHHLIFECYLNKIST